jgi:putative DNA primase/helicase
MSDRIDFGRIARAALGASRRLLEAWLPDGKVVGDHEWCALNPRRADGQVGSFMVNMKTGAWGDFASGDVGKDFVSLCAYLFHDGDQVEAAYELAAELGEPMPPRKRKKPVEKKAPAPAPAKAGEKPREAKKTFWHPVIPAPLDAPEPHKAHEWRGVPERVWCYRDADGRVLGYVYRFIKSTGGKEICPLVWCKHEKNGREGWQWLQWAEPRPLYGLDRLAAKPDATVLIVEGEKCADVAHEQLPDLVAMSWPGGSNAVDKVFWGQISGRKVVIWPDCDSEREKLSKSEKEAGVDPLAKPFMAEAKQPGMKAALKIAATLAARGCKVWLVDIPKPGEKPGGWDIADAVADGLKGEELAAWVRDRARPYLPPDQTPAEAPPPATEAGAGKADKPGKKAKAPPGEPWRAELLWKKGELDDCLANVYDILAHRKEWQGVVAFDEFALRTVKRKPPPYACGIAGEWEGADDSRTAIWLTHQERITPSSTRVGEAIETLGKANPVHPVRDWLRSLPAHDGTARLDTWLIKFLGVADTPYARLVSAWFLIGMVARVMRPGCKHDYCLVLEGLQGRGKSTALRILGGEWYADTDLNLENKDAMAALQGVWLHEFSEMGSLARAESTKQKSFLSRQEDKYRPVYGRRDIRVPRQVCFAGSTNEWEWNKDPTGGRRFWPVLCQLIDLIGLAAAREQLFAEALARFLAGERFHPTKEEQAEIFDPEQLSREIQESFVDALHDWVESQMVDFPTATAADKALKLDASKLTRDVQTRIGIALRKLGCTRVEKRNGMIRYWHRPPNHPERLRERPAAPTGAAQAQPQQAAQPQPQEGASRATF